MAATSRRATGSDVVSVCDANSQAEYDSENGNKFHVRWNPFLGTAAAVLQMQRNGGGSIVNLSSISGVVGQTFVHMSYNAAKGAARIMTKSTAVQFGKDGIRCNSVHPGLMPPMRRPI